MIRPSFSLHHCVLLWKKTRQIRAVALGCILVCVGASISHAKDWPIGRADAAGTGATSDSLPSDLDLVWEVKVDGLGFDAGVIIAGGVVYANDAEGRVLAIELNTGKELWRKEIGPGYIATPAYHSEKLFVADVYGVLRALDPKNGDEEWSYDTEMTIHASPNFYKDSLLFTSEDGTLYCLGIEDGDLRWKYETGDQLQCGPTLAGTRTFLGGCDAHLHIIDVATGDRVGEPLPIDAPTGSTPSVLGEKVFVPTYKGEIFLFGMPDAKQQWRFMEPELSEEFKNSVAVAEGLAVATGRNKRVFAVDAETGEVKWVKLIRKRADASPIIAGDSVFVAASDGRVYRFDLQTGEEQWMFEVKGSLIGSPAAADGKLVLTNGRGSIFCFGKKS